MEKVSLGMDIKEYFAKNDINKITVNISNKAQPNLFEAIKDKSESDTKKFLSELLPDKSFVIEGFKIVEKEHKQDVYQRVGDLVQYKVNGQIMTAKKARKPVKVGEKVSKADVIQITVKKKESSLTPELEKVSSELKIGA